ncbi:MarR family winged helix-turn-helix transcriptional regulator [Kineococcus radiotolerans]|uniref:Transcriptional regulator, MarR family n=1 Tax=Kineococcus radiotolerans (strain ATCC BAA-149 / DSM 14245 / SRS30216) TaxID=266940 RepID=A6W9D0_KINRD|nr:MarR family winged helix-turn-helix transcriptional regulator [Kineococcus radiotolerans]ABS03419.1 transcriptional regulator, MarR family [Kineococcus radiotolerans SRS30216 = ATCC BAA-149]
MTGEAQDRAGGRDRAGGPGAVPDPAAREDVRLANEAWESLFRAQSVLARRFSADDVWQEVSPTEYDVLHTLVAHEERHRDPGGPEGLSMVEINREVLLTQGGISRLVARLVAGGLLQRRGDPCDRRATRVVLTPAGRAVQRAVGRRHARAVSAAMTAALTGEQLRQLRDLTRQLTERAARGPGG